MTSISTCLWFDPDVAPRAIKLYTDLIPNSRQVFTQTFRNGAQDTGEVQIWTLEIAGSPVQIMAASYGEKFTTAHSMWLVVEDQQALDHVWDGFLAAGGKEMACGWIADPFGVPWQIIPAAWERLTETDDREQAQRVAEALWQMVRIDVDALERAARG